MNNPYNVCIQDFILESFTEAKPLIPSLEIKFENETVSELVRLIFSVIPAKDFILL